jgi:hypothetical protein
MLTLNDLIKYVIEGFAVSVSAYLIAGQKSDMKEIVMLGLTAAVTFLVLDLFTPGIGSGARQGAGFGLGINQVGFFGEGFTSEEEETGADASNVEVTQRRPNYSGYTVGENLHGHPLGFDPQTQTYGKQEDPRHKVDYMGEVPYRFPNVYHKECPQFPSASDAKTDDYGPTRTGSRWMGWNENGRPLNVNTCEYKIAPGLYSKYIVQPGYREKIKTANSRTNDLLAPRIWPTKNPLDRKYFLMREPFAPDEGFVGQVAGGADCAASVKRPSEGFIEGFENPQRVRMSDVLYSGDLINITSGSAIIQRGLVNSQIVFDKPLPSVKTNLSKLRIVAAAKKHDPAKQSPIRYGEPVYIMHNAMVNNKNENKFVKYGDRMQSHQDGPLFRTYKIYLKSNAKSQDYIQPGADVIISRGDQEGDKVFLKVENDKSVSSEATSNEATVFKVNLERVFELHDKNLCVCPGETLFP